MDYLEALEYPLPIMKTEMDQLVVETSKDFEGSFSIVNVGGNVLEGEIVSNCQYLSFQPSVFKGNDVTITYVVRVAALDAMNVVYGQFTIMSNGGEKTMDVHIKITPPFLSTKEHHAIYTLEDFYQFAMQNPTEARFLFASQEFLLWLQEIEYNKMEIYEHFIRDANKERGLDHFFQANFLKKRTQLELPQERITIFIPPFGEGLITQEIQVNKTDFGYVKTTIATEHHVPWIVLETKSLNTFDFMEQQSKNISFFINTKLVPHKYNREKIIFEAYKKTILVEVIKKEVVTVQLSKSHYILGDEGYIYIRSCIERDIPVEIQTSHPMVRFEGKKYFINGEMKIPFQVKTTTFQSAQRYIQKQQVTETTIYLTFHVNDLRIRRQVKVYTGTLI